MSVGAEFTAPGAPDAGSARGLAPEEQFGAVPAAPHPWARPVLAAGALALAAGLIALLAWLVAPGVAAPPPRSPFGIGFREAAPAATGFGATLLALQASFSRSLNAAVTALANGGGWQPLVALAFAYGVFHAAGPGHGKAVIAGYILAGERALARGCTLSFCAALLQALVAIAIVGVGALALNATAAGMNRAGNLIETGSFALVALVGLALTWRKAGRLAQLGGPSQAASNAACGPGCAHAPDPATLGAGTGWRERVGVVLAAGSRPCAGAVLVLVFALAQGAPGAGVAAVLAMALGTAITTAALACLAVFAKRAALRLAGGRGRAGLVAVGGLELLAAACVAVLGLAMLSGLALNLGG